MIYRQVSHCAVLVATKNRWDFLTKRAFPSIHRQLYTPQKVVLVNDGLPFGKTDLTMLQDIIEPIPIEILCNDGKPGAAGAWNTGLRYLRKLEFDGYIAILDDDDEWDEDHLLCNMTKAKKTDAEVVISGLRRLVAGQPRLRQLPKNLKVTDFFCGNPGLQGTNTFVSLKALERVGDFTDGLPSLNDRDLAVRLLKSSCKVAYTERWTATWHHGVNRQTLSSPRSRGKIIGLQWFWKQYGSQMNSKEQRAYFDRAMKCFGVTHEEIKDNWGVDKIGTE
jgi:GT2 family glycosyltransferase